MFDILRQLGIIKSKGMKRTLASMMLMIAQLPIPALLPYQPLLLQVATALGAAGLLNAVVDGK